MWEDVIPALLEVLGGNTEFRHAVVDKMFYEGQRQFKFNEMMGIFLPSELNQAHEMAFYVFRLGNRSRLFGRSPLDSGSGRLVGYLAPEAPNALVDTMQRVVNPERRILTVSEVLNETNQTSAYAPDQIVKLQNILDQRGYVISSE